MKKFERELKNVFQSVKLDSKDKMLEAIHSSNNSLLANIFESVTLSRFRKLKIWSKISIINFFESLRVSKLQMASFMLLFVVFANLTLPVFMTTTSADFAPNLSSNANFLVERLDSNLSSNNMNLLIGDNVVLNDFSTLSLSMIAELRAAKKSKITLSDYQVNEDIVNYSFEEARGEFWFNLISKLNQSFELNVSTPVCNISASKDSIFYLKSTETSLIVQNFKKELFLDCESLNGKRYKLNAGESFKLSLLEETNLGFNNVFLLKNIGLDKQLKESALDTILDSDSLSLYEINKLLISLKLANFIEIDDFDFYVNRLDIIKLNLKKVLYYGLKNDQEKFDESFEGLKLLILDFKNSLNSAKLDDLTKTNLYSLFLSWINTEIKNTSLLLPLDFQILLKSQLFEIVFVYFNDYVDYANLESYLALLQMNISYLKGKSDEFRFVLLKSLYLFKGFVPQDSGLAFDQILEIIASLSEENHFFYESSNLSTLSIDKDKGLNLEISNIDKDIYLETINF